MDVYDELFIDGEWVRAESPDRITVISPVTEEPLATVPDANTTDVDRCVAAARRAFDSSDWSRRTPQARAELVRALSSYLKEHAQEIAQTVTTEMGSPASFSLMAQAIAPAAILDTFVDLVSAIGFEEHRDGFFGPTIVRREPVGVCAAITPWNVPLFVTASKLGPALISGCTVVLKPAPETPLSAFALAEAVRTVGFPPGVVNVVPAGRAASEYLVTHPDIDKVAFTGSTETGRRIAALCGERLRRVSLELGGKSACIVLDDAPIDALAESLMHASFMNNGQACVAQARILVPRTRYDTIVEAIVERTKQLVVGDPSDPKTHIGPLVSARHRARVEGYIEAGRAEGADVMLGGSRPHHIDRGWFLNPTIFTNVDNAMTIAREEIFGPVIGIIAYDTPEDAVRIANDSDYGLSGSVWTNDVARGLDIARRVRTGTYTVNGLTLEFRAPFGGFKHSGLGREMGPEGFTPYLEDKTISLPPSSDPSG